MKKLIIALILFVFSHTYGQQSLPGDLGAFLTWAMQNSGELKPVSFGLENINIDDNITIKNYIGSPLWLPKWVKADVLFNDRKLYHLPHVNYDALDDSFMIYFKDLKKDIPGFVSTEVPILNLKSDNLLTVTLFDKEDGVKKFVRVSYLNFSEKPKQHFFQYFSDKPKNALILKEIYKVVVYNKLKGMPYSDANEDYAIKTYKRFYIKTKGSLFKPASLGKRNILKILNDKSHERDLKKYIKKQGLKMNRPQDVQKFLSYYHKTFVK